MRVWSLGLRDPFFSEGGFRCIRFRHKGPAV